MTHVSHHGILLQSNGITTFIRNYFARRQALVEIDVVAAMALGLTLDELIMMYKIQFPVLQQNEQDTWYDVNGQIVFTCSKGLTGVGLDRKGTPRSGILGWEDIRGEAISDEHGNFIGYQAQLQLILILSILTKANSTVDRNKLRCTIYQVRSYC